MAPASRKRRWLSQYLPAVNDCTYCRRALHGEVKIECADCPPVRLAQDSVGGSSNASEGGSVSCRPLFCVDCFSVGVEIRGHLRSHAYRFLDIARVPLLERSWGAHEELRLLEALQLYGFGNWHDIAQHVGLKGKDECEAHYRKYYLDSPTFPLPDLSKPVDEGSAGDDQDRSSSAQQVDVQPKLESHDESSTTEPDVAASTSTEIVSDTKHRELFLPPDARRGVENARLQPVAAPDASSSAPDASSSAPDASSSAPAQSSTIVPPSEGALSFSGFMPLRGEFDVEWDDEAELLIADMEFAPEESEAERSAKLKVLTAYNHTLDERQRRRDFVVRNDMFDELRRQLESERQASAEERALRSSLRPFGRLHSPERHEALVQQMLREASLADNIQQLERAHASGTRSLEDFHSQLASRRQTHAPARGPAGLGKGASGKGLGKFRGAGLGKGHGQGLGKGHGQGLGKAASSGLGKGAVRSDASRRAMSESAVGGGRADERSASHCEIVSRATKRLSQLVPAASALLSEADSSLCEELFISTDLFVRSKRRLVLESARCAGALGRERALAALRPQLDDARAARLWQHVACGGLAHEPTSKGSERRFDDPRQGR